MEPRFYRNFRQRPSGSNAPGRSFVPPGRCHEERKRNHERMQQNSPECRYEANVTRQIRARARARYK